MPVRRRLLVVAASLIVVLAAIGVATRVLMAVHTAPGGLSVSGTGTASQAGALLGAWRVGAGSEAGYRAREKFVTQPDVTEAVARTSSVTGGFSIESTATGPRVRGIDFSVDLRTLVSQDSYATFQTYQRDFFVRRIYLESDHYPFARFQGADLPLPSALDPGSRVAVSGKLTVHGTTRPVVAQIQVQPMANSLDVSGSISVDMRDFDIEVPSIAFTTAEPVVQIEFLLHLSRK